MAGVPKVSKAVLEARKRVALAKQDAVNAYLEELRSYRATSRYMRANSRDDMLRSVGGPARPRMDAVVGTTAHAPVPWRGVNMRSNTDARKYGGPGDMRIQGKRLDSQWTEPSKRVTAYPLIDHRLCDGAGCGYRIDLRKHEYYNIGERVLCERCG